MGTSYTQPALRTEEHKDRVDTDTEKTNRRTNKGRQRREGTDRQKKRESA